MLHPQHGDSPGPGERVSSIHDQATKVSGRGLGGTLDQRGTISSSGLDGCRSGDDD